MTRTDFRTIFLALGFLAATLRDEQDDKRYPRAATIAGLMEAFCFSSIPEVLIAPKELLNRYITELRETGSASMDFDRQTLLQMYELLHIKKLRYEQREFYAAGDDSLIANRILQMVEENIGSEAA